MKRYLPHLLALAGLASCAVPGGSGLPDGELGRRFSATVPGTWSSAHRQGGATVDGEKTFFRDGSARGVLRYTERSGGFSVVMPTVSFRSKWRVEGDTYISYDVKSPMQDAFPPGTEYRDLILSVEQDRIVCRDGKSGDVFTMERKR